MIALSVIIPTYNRKDVLKMCLEALNQQSCSAKRFEVIIVDDGSTDGTVREITKLTTKFKFKTSIFSQKNRGPASARNKGIKEAIGKIILIINDDTIPSRDLIKKHLNFHKIYRDQKMGLLGYVTWHPNLKITPFMRWLEHGGPYFSFSEIKRKKTNWERFWTCNISLKRIFLLKNGLFDEEFPYAAWEDVELGYRLGKKGLQLFYDKSVLAYHYHSTTIRSIKNKMVSNGFSALLLKKKIPARYLPPIGRHPDLFIFLDKIFFNSVLVFCLENTCLFFESKLNLNIIFSLLLLHYRITGLKNYIKK